MGKLFINATKNFGNKIDEAINRSNGRIDGIHYSIADISRDKISRLNIGGIYKFPEFPLYYLTINNDYIDSFFNRDPKIIDNEKKFIPSEKNNKLICMGQHVDFSFLNKLPLSTLEYSDKRESILDMINHFYNTYYPNNYIMTPTFIINKVGSWEEIMLVDVLKSTKGYLEDNPKEAAFLSILLDPTLLDNSDIASNIISYVEMYPFINNFSLTIISDDSMYYHTKDVYKNVLTFIRDLNARDINVHLQYCGIKDVVFSVLDVKRFSVGWFGSYRNFDTNSKRISEVNSSAFGKRVKKVLTENFMSEIPLDYLNVLSPEECQRLFEIDQNRLDIIDFKELEQRYWAEMLKIIEKNESIEEEFEGDELLSKRCDNLKRKIFDAIDNLELLIERLNDKARYSDAKKIKNNNLKHVKLYGEVLDSFQEKLFF